MTLSLDISPDLEARLRRKAARRGQALADYLLQLAEADAQEDGDAGGADAASVIVRYERRELTHGEAARLLGLSRAAFLEELGQRGVSPFQYDAAEVLAEAGL